METRLSRPLAFHRIRQTDSPLCESEWMLDGEATRGASASGSRTNGNKRKVFVRSVAAKALPHQEVELMETEHSLPSALALDP